LNWISKIRSKEALLNDYAEYRSWDELKKGQYTKKNYLVISISIYIYVCIFIINQDVWKKKRRRAQCQYLFSSFFLFTSQHYHNIRTNFWQSTVRWESKQIRGCKQMHTYTSQVYIFTGIYEFNLYFILIFLLYRLLFFVSIVLNISI